MRDGDELVPFTKAYSGLTDAEFREITDWVQKNTLERFGPVRRVPAELVFEIAFEGIQASPRHKIRHRAALSPHAALAPATSRWPRSTRSTACARCCAAQPEVHARRTVNFSPSCDESLKSNEFRPSVRAGAAPRATPCTPRCTHMRPERGLPDDPAPAPPRLRCQCQPAAALGKLPDWDLTDLYTAPDAPGIRRATWHGWKRACAGFRGQPTKASLAALDAAGLLACVQEYERIDVIAGRLMSFAGLRYYQNTMDSERAKFMADAQDRITTFTTPLVFFSLEFNRLDDDASCRACWPRTPILPATSRSSTGCARCAPTSCRTSWRSSCTTSRVVGAAAWNKLFDETMAGLMFTVAGEDEELNLEATLNLLTDPDRAQREAAAQALAEVFEQEHQALRPRPQHAGQGKGNRGPLAQDADAADRPAPVEPCRARGGRGAAQCRRRRLSEAVATATTG